MIHLYKKICLSGSSDFLEFSLVTDVWQQRFPRFFAGDRRLAAAISSTFRCCQTSVNSVFLLNYIVKLPLTLGNIFHWAESILPQS